MVLAGHRRIPPRMLWELVGFGLGCGAVLCDGALVVLAMGALVAQGCQVIPRGPDLESPELGERDCPDP